MLKKAFALAVLAALLPVVLAACGGGADEAPTPTTVIAPTTAPGGGEVQVEEVLLSDAGGVVLFKPDNFTFKVGQKVRLVLTAEDQFHTFTVDDLTTEEGQEVDVNVFPGVTETFEFTPSQAGTFNLICVPHNNDGMVGTITVEN